MDFETVFQQWERQHGVNPNVAGEGRQGVAEPQPSLRELEKFHIQAELDLHGLKRDQAETALFEFLKRCQREGYRKILIIHGKGLHSDSPQSVLKLLVDKVLRRYPTALRFGHAKREQGGSGATWVWLSAHER